MKRFCLIAAGCLIWSASAFCDSLWFGNDTAGTDYHTDLAGNTLSTLAIESTGVAWDGSNLYFGHAFSGVIEKRSADGSTLLNSFVIPNSGNPAEDMAWDPKRQRLWRVYHNSPTIQRFTTTGTLDGTFAFSTTDPDGILDPLGTLGVAYDSTRDQLDVSFCQQGCGAIGGVVIAYDPDTLAPIGEVFRSFDHYIGGLGYDPATDTLWAGGENALNAFTVTHYTRSGVILSEFNANVFGDGMEFIPAPAAVPEPSSLALMSLALAGVVRRIYKAKLNL